MWGKTGTRPYGNLQNSLPKVDDKFTGSPVPPVVYRSVKTEVKRRLCEELHLHPLPKAVKRVCHLQTHWESLRAGAGHVCGCSWTASSRAGLDDNPLTAGFEA